MTTPRQRKFAILAWMWICVLWGTTYLAIRLTLDTMPPLLMPGIRWTIAGSTLFAWLLIRGQRLPSRAAWPGIVMLGVLMIVLGNAGVVWAELTVPSGLAALIVASNPFWMAGVEASRADGERLTWTRVLGFLVGFSGIVLLVWPELARVTGAAKAGFLAGVVSLQVACFGWALGSSYSKRHARDENILAVTAGQMLSGGLMLLALGTLHGEWAHLGFSTRSAMAFTYLTTIAGVGGFGAYTYALRHLPVSLVSLYAYVNPVIAVALGVLVLGERFTWRMGLAAALVFGGVAIVQRRDQTRRPLIRRTRKSTIAMTSST